MKNKELTLYALLFGLGFVGTLFRNVAVSATMLLVLSFALAYLILLESVSRRAVYLYLSIGAGTTLVALLLSWVNKSIIMNVIAGVIFIVSYVVSNKMLRTRGL